MNLSQGQSGLNDDDAAGQRRGSIGPASGEGRQPQVPAQAAQRVSSARHLPQEIVIRYRPIAELEKWLSQRLDDRTKGKTAYVVLVATVFAMFVVPVVTLLLGFIIHWLNNMFGGGAVASGVEVILGNYSVLLNMFLTVAGLVLSGTIAYNALPTHLALNAKGMRLLWRHAFFKKEGKIISWDHIKNMSLFLPGGKTSPLDHILRFSLGPGKFFKLRLGCIPSSEERAKLLESVDLWAPDLNRDAASVQALELPPDHSYTELWLQALSGPPKRERLTPLTQTDSLRDGRFVIARPLGVGGQGTAYLAYDRENQQEVVLKEFILPVFVDVNVRRKSLESFEKEARILRQLNHEQIVQLIDFFVEDHRGYLVLEHIDGNSLRELVLSSGAMSEAKVRELAGQMCKMLSYLHGLTPPVVHRDFTPDNLILRKDGKLKLVDFNVAQQKESTATGTVVGKHAYLPPEQFRGQPTTQSDIYSMGASLFFILTAQEPEPISRQHPRLVQASLSEDIDRLVSRATEIDLKDRYKNAEEIAADLSAAGVH